MEPQSSLANPLTPSPKNTAAPQTVMPIKLTLAPLSDQSAAKPLTHPSPSHLTLKPQITVATHKSPSKSQISAVPLEQIQQSNLQATYYPSKNPICTTAATPLNTTRANTSSDLDDALGSINVNNLNSSLRKGF